MIFVRLVTNKCNIRNWNYTQLGEMSYAEASVYLQGLDMVDEIPCWSMETNRFAYDNDGLSLVSEVFWRYFHMLRHFKIKDKKN